MFDLRSIKTMSFVRMFGHLVEAVLYMLAAVGGFAAGCVAGVLTPILVVTSLFVVMAFFVAVGACLGIAATTIVGSPLLGVIGVGVIGAVVGFISGTLSESVSQWASCMKMISKAVWKFMSTQTKSFFESAGIFLKEAGTSLRAAFKFLEATLNIVARNISTLIKVLYSGIRILFWNVMKVSMVILAAAWGLAALLGPGAFLMMKGAPIWFSVCAAIFSHGFMGALISLGLGAVLFSAIVGTVFALLCLKPMLHCAGPCIGYIFKQSDLAWEDLKNCTRASRVVNAHQADDQKGSTEVLVDSDLDAHNQQDAGQSLKRHDSTLSCVVQPPLKAVPFSGRDVSGGAAEGLVLTEDGDDRTAGSSEIISAYPVR